MSNTSLTPEIEEEIIEWMISENTMPTTAAVFDWVMKVFDYDMANGLDLTALVEKAEAKKNANEPEVGFILCPRHR